MSDFSLSMLNNDNRLPAQSTTATALFRFRGEWNGAPETPGQRYRPGVSQQIKDRPLGSIRQPVRTREASIRDLRSGPQMYLARRTSGENRHASRFAPAAIVRNPMAERNQAESEEAGR